MFIYLFIYYIFTANITPHSATCCPPTMCDTLTRVGGRAITHWSRRSRNVWEILFTAHAPPTPLSGYLNLDGKDRAPANSQPCDMDVKLELA